ncbi:hypothetical protein Tco_0235715 [Tanacetum coccineum]
MSTTNKESRPHAAASFMANLMQTGPSTGQGTSNDTDFHSEIHGGEQLDSDVDSVIDDHDNTIPYHQYQLNNEVESVPTDVTSIIPSGISMITILDDLRSQLAGHIKTNEEQSFANDSLKAELERYKTQICNNSGSPELNVFFEINKLKDHLQGKDELIRKLKAQIGNIKEVIAESNLSTLEFQALETKNTQLKEELTAVRIKNASLRDENVSIKKRYQYLYRSKAESNSNVSSRATVPEKPKVLAHGLYAMMPKYIPPQKRNNREANTHLPRKETKDIGKIFASVGSKWRPTGRKLTLGDTCPLTRITKPEVVALEKSGSVSTNGPANNVIVTPRFSKKPLTSYKCKDSKLKDISTGSPPNTKTKAVNDPVNVDDLSANQLNPNKNWVSDVPNSTAL